MPILRGQQLQEYMAWKQGQPMTAGFEPPVERPDDGFLMSMGKGITKPFRATAENIAEIGAMTLDPRRWLGMGG